MVRQSRTDSKIWVPYGNGKKIARLMGVTPECVSESLSGRRQTKTAERIRHRALNDFGGVEINN